MDILPIHQPVLLAEAVEQLLVRPGGTYLDATAGEGGHASSILEVSSPSGTLLGIDLDPRALARAKRTLGRFGRRTILVQGNYSDMESLSQDNGVEGVDGVLMDLGFSSFQIQDPDYGLSFTSDEPLDMRYDPAAGLTAARVVNTYSEEDLTRLIYRYGQEPRARTIARRIVRGRPVESAARLAGLLAEALGRRRGRKIHPATRTFQALRIEVNNELGNLAEGLAAATRLLAPAGRLVVISYHSLEDRAVKAFLARESARCVCPREIPVCVCGQQPTLELVRRRVIRPSAQEVQQNPRSRSAKMRVAQRH